MGKKNQYLDDYTGDVKSIKNRHKKFRALMTALCITGLAAAGGATYVLMNPAQTMTKEGIDEMDPNAGFVVSDENSVNIDGPVVEDAGEEENYDSVPLIEEWTDETQAPADVIPSEDPNAPDEAALPGAAPEAAMPGAAPEASMPGSEPEAGALVTDVAQTETEIAEAAPAVVQETAAPESDAPAVVGEIVGTSEEELAETVETAAPAAEVETDAPEAVGQEVPAAAETEAPEEAEPAIVAAVAETEAPEEAESETTAASETESVEAAQTEEAQTEAVEAAETEAAEEDTEAEAPETEAAETEEAKESESEPASEAAESETQAAEIREKSKDEVYVETEGELLDEKWIDSVGLEIKTEDGWITTKAAKNGTIEVDADQILRFRVTYTVQPGTLSPEMRTLIYQIPKEVTRVEESYGEIVDSKDNVLANYAIDEDGLIRVTFMEDVAQMNADGTKVTCKIEFRTQASNLAK